MYLQYNERYRLDRYFLVDQASLCDSVVDFIESKLDEQPEFYEIEYNEEYGYPETLYFDMSKMIADEEIGYNISNFKITN